MAVADLGTTTPPQSRKVIVVNHPLVATKLSVLRARTTAPQEFRRNLNEISLLLAFEASREWETEAIEVQTPLMSSPGVRLASSVALVPILRAGLGMSDAISQLVPQVSIGHLGIYRDEKTLRPVSYYRRLPSNIGEARVLLLDPMLATGFSACEAISILKQHGAQRIQFLCLISCGSGIEQLHRDHPEVQIITAAIDPELNDFGYIVPGLGDAGDRYFGTEPM
jgi:uracil phosphoribosyltransferase